MYACERLILFCKALSCLILKIIICNVCCVNIYLTNRMDCQLVEPIRKNYEERMNEFVNILNREDCLPGSKVLDLWRFHLELTLKKSGWIALYKPGKGVKQISPSMDFNSELLMVRYYFYITHPPFILNNNNIIFISLG